MKSIAWLALIGVTLTGCGASNSDDPATGTAGNGAVSPRSGQCIPASCSAMQANLNSQCSYGSLSTATSCEKYRLDMEPMGCGPAYSSYVLCATKAKRDCENGGPIGCEQQQAAHLSCHSLFAREFSCTRGNSVADENCSAAACQPYGFGCLEEIPDNCSDSPIGSVYEVCCESFAVETTSCFID